MEITPQPSRYPQIIAVLAIVALLVWGGSFWWKNRPSISVAYNGNNNSAIQLTGNAYYDQLTLQCSDSCCQASVDQMRAIGARVVPASGCPGGSTENSLKCISSYSWCETATTNINASTVPTNVATGAVLTTFTDPGLGLTFMYPASFGTVTISQEAGDPGTLFRGSFSNNSELHFGGISTDFAAGRGGVITDTRGFASIQNTFYFLSVNSKADNSYPLEPLDLLTTADGEPALLLEDYSFVADRNQPDSPTLANSLGAFHLAGLLNLKGETYPGVIFVNNNLDVFPRQQFVDLLESIVIE